MNRAQALAHEPDGTGLRWMVAELSVRRRPWAANPNGEGSLPACYRAEQPNLRADYAIRLWNVICETAEPLAKAAWLDQAKVGGKRQRVLGSNAIHNLLRGGWVILRDGLYRKAA